jgi:hypothetical protein
MSIPKEKTILLKIIEIVKEDAPNNDKMDSIEALVKDYVDPGYIGGPIVGEAEGGKEE